MVIYLNEEVVKHVRFVQYNDKSFSLTLNYLLTYINLLQLHDLILIENKYKFYI